MAVQLFWRAGQRVHVSVRQDATLLPLAARRLPPFTLTKHGINDTSDISDAQVEGLLTELPEHEVQRFQVRGRTPSSVHTGPRRRELGCECCSSGSGDGGGGMVCSCYAVLTLTTRAHARWPPRAAGHVHAHHGHGQQHGGGHGPRVHRGAHPQRPRGERHQTLGSWPKSEERASPQRAERRVPPGPCSPRAALSPRVPVPLRHSPLALHLQRFRETRKQWIQASIDREAKVRRTVPSQPCQPRTCTVPTHIMLSCFLRSSAPPPANTGAPGQGGVASVGVRHQRLQPACGGGHRHPAALARLSRAVSVPGLVPLGREPRALEVSARSLAHPHARPPARSWLFVAVWRALMRQFAREAVRPRAAPLLTVSGTND